MNNYKPNSRLSKTDDKKEEVKKEKVEKVVKGVVKSKKRNGFLKLFLSDDIVDIKDYVLCDVLIPAAKKAIDDIVSNGISMMLYGETGRAKRSSTASRVSYRSFYEREDRDQDRSRNRSRSNGFAFDEIILETRGEAEDVINRLDELIDVYGMASVGDLYDLVGLSSSNYTINNYGWTDIRSASHVRVRDGYLLKMPRAIPLN